MKIKMVGVRPPFDNEMLKQPIEINGERYYPCEWTWRGMELEIDCITEEEHARIWDERIDQILEMM